MAVALVADAHLGGPGGEIDPLLEQLEGLPGAGCGHLVLLGDLFQVWVGFPSFETPDILRLCRALERLREQGVRVDYVEGNRDFFLQGGRYRRSFDQVGLETEFEAGGRRYLAVHGDGLNADDRQYLFWRALSKSWLSRALLRSLPRFLAHRAVDTTERRLSGTNFKHKQRIPREVIEAYAAERLAEGYDEVLLGHFHEPREWPVAGGRARIVEAWFTSRRVEWFGRRTESS